MSGERQLKLRYAYNPTNFGKDEGGAGSFEGLLRALLAGERPLRLAAFGDRTVYLLHYDVAEGGVYLHFVLYKHNDSTTAFGDPRVAAPAELQAVPPPVDQQFVDSTLLFLVNGNDVISCRSVINTDGPLIVWAHEASAAKGFRRSDCDAVLQDRANLDKLDTIMRDGVKAIRFDAVASHVAARAVDRDTAAHGIIGAVLDQLRSFGGEGMAPGEPADDMKVSVSLGLNSRRANLVTDKVTLDLARQAIEDDNGGFEIVTGKNATLGADDVKIQKPVRLRMLGKHPNHVHGWEAMTLFSGELRARDGRRAG